MNTKTYLLIFVALAVVLSGCSVPAPTQIAAATRGPAQQGQAPVQQEKAPIQHGQAPVQYGQAIVTQNVEVIQELPAATEAPAANEGSGYPNQPPMDYPTQAPFMPPPPGTVPTPVDNYFQDYGVNPYTDAFEDHLSTFALDVDTASYSVARRYVEDGNLPPSDAVRVEEFVNYFEPGLPNARGRGLCHLRRRRAFAVPPRRHATSCASASRATRCRSGERKPATLTFVIDVSGSMEQENRLELVKRSLETAGGSLERR